MSEKKSIDLGLTSALDELFMDERGRKENALPKIYDIGFSPAEKKLVRYCLMELRSKLLAADLDTDDVDALLQRLMA